MTHGTKFSVRFVLVLALVATGLYALNVNTWEVQSPSQENEVMSTTTNSTSNPRGTVESGQTTGQQCIASGGTWSEEYKECTGINQSNCQEIGGTFNECASACRHNPNAQVCIMMCVAVCTF